MQKMKEALSFWACSRLQGRKWQNTRVYISGADVPGEGEIKVIHFIKSMREQNIHGPEDSYCIVGSDAGSTSKFPTLHLM
jgi:5'-3' exoribonuclease 2